MKWAIRLFWGTVFAGAFLACGLIWNLFAVLSHPRVPMAAEERPLVRMKAQAPRALPAPPPGPKAALFLDGAILVPEPLRELLQGKHALLSISATVDAADRTGFSYFAGGSDLEVTTFPKKYRLRLPTSFKSFFASRPKVPVIVHASICYDFVGGPLQKLVDVVQGACNPGSLPSMRGWVSFPVEFPGGADALRGASVITAPDLVVRRLMPRPDPAACAREGGTLRGRVQATAAYLRDPRRAGRIELIAAPLNAGRPPRPYFGESSVSPTKDELDRMGAWGILRQTIDVTDSRPVTFFFAIPERYRGATYEIFAAPCRQGQSEDECTAAALPLKWTTMARENESIFRLVPRNFAPTQCGHGEQLYYLHRWDPGAPPATDESMRRSDPPELIEGSVY